MSGRRGRLRPRWSRVALVVSSATVTGVAVLGGLGGLGVVGEPVAIPKPATAVAPAAAVPADRSPAPVLRSSADAAEAAVSPALDTTLPAGSGTGRRIVFSEGRQRVWLVERGSRVTRTYLVSGSVYDNLEPGTYAVYSRSVRAYGIDDSGTMRHFVRFTQGDNAAIGFHDIPVDDGRPVQTVAELGVPTSHGCIRQKRSDARALWRFAPVGTTVVVTA